MQKIIWIFCLLTLVRANSQPLDSLDLPMVTIEASRLRWGVGQSIEKVDSTTLERLSLLHLGDLLNVQTGVFVKSYGVGSLATPTFRGTAAHHTAILWNGINLQSAMNGVSDLALLPVFLMDEVAVVQGGSAALFGGGAMGGVLHLKSSQPTKNQLFINIGVGSFGTQKAQFKGAFQKGHFRNSTQFFIQKADNDFPYQTPTTTRRMTNAALSQLGFLQEFFLQLPDNQSVSLHWWHQQSDRQIAPTLTQAQNLAFQNDATHRFLLHWKKATRHSLWQVKTAFLEEKILYTDSLILLVANNLGKSLVSEGEFRSQLTDNQEITLGVQHTFNQAQTDNYDGRPRQHQAALFGAYRWSKRRWAVGLSLRQAYLQRVGLPFTFAAEGSWQATSSLKIRTKITRNYQAPTFNDLYWSPGGNSELKPEIGWNQEVGFDYLKSSLSKNYKFNFTLYNHFVQNWIQWLPTSAGYWSPSNLKTVWGRGAEINAKIDGKSHFLNWQITTNYALNFSTNYAVNANLQHILGKQLVYTPLHKGNAAATFFYEKWSLTYSHQFVGRRYTTSDNAESLPFFSTADFFIEKTINYKSLIIKGLCKVGNVWATNYQVIAFRPMPLRSIEISFHFSFK